MSDNNNAPFYVGQRVVAIQETPYLKIGEVYRVKSCYWAKCCKKWIASVGITGTGKHRCLCGNIHNLINNVVYHNAAYLAPIDERTVSIPESLKEQAAEMISVKETIKQPEKELA